MWILIQREWVKSVFIIKDTSLTKKLSDWVKRNVMFTITGASWVGKDTILNSILKNSDKYIKPVSFTTRLPRPWEIEWVDYYFISMDKYWGLKKNWEVFNNTIVSNNIYWYTKKELERVFETWKTPLCIVNEDWMNEISKNSKWDICVFKTFILPPSARELVKRLKLREFENSLNYHLKNHETISREDLFLIKKESRESTKKRFSESKDWIRRALGEEIYDWFLINDDVEWAAKILEEIYNKVLVWNLK